MAILAWHLRLLNYATFWQLRVASNAAIWLVGRVAQNTPRNIYTEQSNFTVSGV